MNYGDDVSRKKGTIGMRWENVPGSVTEGLKESSRSVGVQTEIHQWDQLWEDRQVHRQRVPWTKEQRVCDVANHSEKRNTWVFSFCIHQVCHSIVIGTFLFSFFFSFFLLASFDFSSPASPLSSFSIHTTEEGSFYINSWPRGTRISELSRHQPS